MSIYKDGDKVRRHVEEESQYYEGTVRDEEYGKRNFKDRYDSSKVVVEDLDYAARLIDESELLPSHI